MEQGKNHFGRQDLQPGGPCTGYDLPTPLNPKRYVVLNSGHTFHTKDYRGTNSLLLPRLGDYAVLRLSKAPNGNLEATVELAGLFRDNWELIQP